jgi:hypothetical protein
MHLGRAQCCHASQGSLDEIVAGCIPRGVAIGAGIHFHAGHGLFHQLHRLTFISDEEGRGLVELACRGLD